MPWHTGTTRSDLREPQRLEIVEPGDPHCAHIWAGRSTPTPKRESWIKCANCGQHLRWENNR